MTHKTAVVVALVSGVIMAIGSLMPWVSVRSGLGSVSVMGTDGDGVISLVAGAAVALLALVHLDRPASAAARGLIALGGVIGGWIVAIDFPAAQERIAAIDSAAIAASVGPGLYLLGIGAVGAIIGAVQMRGLAAEQAGPSEWHEP